jgi:TonB family protein
MYWKHFGLHEDPFSLTSDSRFLFLTEAHRDVLNTLRECVEGERGFAALIAPSGVGKTTLLYELIEQLRETAVVAFIFETHFEPIDILRLLLKELGQDVARADAIALHQQFAEALSHVAKLGKRFAVVIDEAQALSPAALETIRLLSNFDLNRKKPVQVILAGHQEFEELLARPGMQHIKQRIAAYGRLKPFTTDETRAYVAHRLHVAGGAGLFAPEALDVLAELSRGVPRTINIYGFQTLQAAIKSGARQADAELTRRAIHEFEGWPLPATAPVMSPRVNLTRDTAPKSTQARPRNEKDDYFETGKDAALEALLANIRSDRERGNNERFTVTPTNVPVPPVPVVTPVMPAAAKAEPIPFSIAAAIKTTEPIPVTASRSAVAAAPALDKQPEPSIADAAPPAAPVAKAPVLVVPAPEKPVPASVPIVGKQKAAMPPKLRMQVAVAVLVLLLLGSGGTFAYRRGWFRATQLASASTAVTQPAASGVAARQPDPSVANPAPLEATRPTSVPEQAPAETRKAAASAVAPPPVRVAEIGAGKARSLMQTDAAPSAPVTLGVQGQPNLGSALDPSATGVTLQTARPDVKPAVAISQPKPVYPPMASSLRLEGTVVLRVQVDAHGKPTKVDIVSGHPMLAAAAKNTVLSSWRFTPAAVGNKNVASETEVRINFKGSR